MAKRKKHNPERRAYRGRSYKKGGKRMTEIDAETFERYSIVKEKLVCPDCGSEVEKITLGELAKRWEKMGHDFMLDEKDNLNAVAYCCYRWNLRPEERCTYCITIGEVEGPIPESIAPVN